MGFFAWIVFGLIAGALAKLLIPGKQPGGFLITMLLGIVGALLGGFLGTRLGFGDVAGFDFRSILLAVIGAVIVLLIYGVVTRDRVTRHA